MVPLHEQTVGPEDDSVTVRDRDGAAAPVARDDLRAGSRLGRYEIREELGRGGMGVVYRAHDPVLDREVALKRLHPRHLDGRARDRLAREAQAMARVSHPHVVPIFDVSTEGDELLVAMEYVLGVTLRAWLRGSPPWPEVLRVLLDAGRGLVAAHARGLVHRDFKPGNVIVGDDGRARVLDFGLAVLGDEPSTLDATGPRPDEEAPEPPSTLTATGAVMGTPAYMAPEQHCSRTSDPRVDQFAFCVTLWEGLTGTRPFDGKYSDMVAAKYRGPPPWPEGSPVPRPVVHALRRGLSPDAGARFADMEQLLAALQPSRRRWPWAVGGGVVLTSLGAVLAGSLASPAPCTSRDDPLAGVWDADRRQRAGEVLQRGETRWAATAWPSVRQTLGEHAAAWRTQRVEACRATRVDHTQPADILDLRMACLDQQREHLRATTEALLAAGPDDLRAVLMEVAALPHPGRCADVDALRAALPPPEDPAAARWVQTLRTEIDRAHTWLEARDDEAVVAELPRLRSEAAAVGYGPVQLEVDLLEGRMLMGRGDVPEGVEAVTRAYERAGELGHDRAAVEAAARLAVATGVLQARHREAQTWAEAAMAGARRLPAGSESEALAHDALGRVLRVSGRSSEAVAAHAHALELRERLHGSDRLITAMTRHRLGYALVLDDQLEPALAALDQATADLEGALGPSHPEVAGVLTTRAMALTQAGRYDEAEALFLRALEIHEATLDPDDPARANVPLMLGDLYVRRSEPARALPHHQRALEIREAAYGPDDSRVATALSIVATVQSLLGRPQESERLHRRVLRIHRAALHEDHPTIAKSLNNLGLSLTELGRHDEAAQAFTEAIEIRERAGGPEALTLASPLTNLGRLRQVQGRASEAESLHRRALALRLEARGPRHLEVASVQHNLGCTLVDLGRHQEAVDVLDEVVTTLEQALGPEHENLVEPLCARGRARLGLGQRDEARAALTRARALVASDDSGKMTAAVAELEDALAGR